jgi:NADH-quinone oxidoreductase subunit E
MNPTQLIAIMERENRGRESLISILEKIQAKYSYLPKEALQIVAERTGSSLTDVYGVATFYKAFSLEPRGKHLISVCLGTACHVQGGPKIAEEFERLLQIKAGGTTEDREFTLETVNCLGACALGPVAVVDGHYFSMVTTSKVSEILEKTRNGLDKLDIDTDKRIFPVEVSCARCNHSLMDPRHPIDGHPSIRVTTSFGDKHGWTAISCLWGSYKVESEYDIPEDIIVNMFCPHCHAELIGGGRCSECDAPMVPMIVRGGGIVQICTRRGCKGHILDLGEAVVE